MKKVVIVVLCLCVFNTVYGADYVNPRIPSMDIIKAMYHKVYKHAEIQSVIGTKTTGYGTRYTVHFVSIHNLGFTHVKRLTCYMLENTAWMIYFGRGETYVLTYEEN